MAFQISDEDVALYMNVFVFSAVVIFALFGFPRLVARLSLPHCEGWLIRRASTGGVKVALDNNSAVFDPKSESTLDLTAGSTESDVAPYKIDLGDSSANKTLPRLRPTTRNAPRLPFHVPSYSTWVHPLSKVSNSRYDGYSTGQYTVLMSYLGVVCVATFLFSNPVNNVTRAGFVCIAQAPIVVLFGVKNGPIGMLLGRGYEKLNYIHRWVGQLMFLSALFHVVGYLVKWTKTGTLSIAAKRQAWGWFAFGGLVFLAILSLPPIRRSSYALFWHAHWVGFFMFAVSMMYHAPGAIPYAVAGLSLYALDQIMRLFKSRVATATLTPVAALKCTQLSVPELARGWRAGQHVRVRVLSSKMGLLGWAETHPFTIASISAPEGGGDGLTLLCKRAGDWTESLYAMSQSPSTSAAEKGEGFGMGSRVQVIIEGPYGGPGSAIPSSFSSALIVAGGSGITFGTSSVEELIAAAENGTTRTKYVELVWVMQEQFGVMPLLPAFATLLARAANSQTLTLAITVHFTRASNDQLPSKLPAGMRIVAGRPNLKAALENVAKRTEMVSTPASRATGIYLGVCGPSGLVEEAWRAEAALEGNMRTLVGGVEVHEEAFGW